MLARYFDHLAPHRFPRAASVLLLSVLCIACDRPDVQPSTVPVAGSPVPLRVAIYEDQDFADRIESGWLGSSERPVEIFIVDDQSLDEISRNNDVLLMPARLMGEAVSKRLISPLPDSFLDTVKVSDVLLQLREVQTRWGGEVYGLSLGTPLTATLINDQVQLDEGTTISYDQFYQLAESLSDESPSAAEPLANGEAAISFLRRAAAYCDSTWLFDPSDFTPVIDGPPYQQALDDLIAVRKFFPRQLLAADEIWGKMLAGELQIALGRPIVSADMEIDALLRVLPPPRASRTFSTQWTDLTESDPQRSLLSGTGLIVAMSTSSRQTRASRAFMQWLCEDGHGSLRRLSNALSTTRVHDPSFHSSGRMQSEAVAQYDLLVENQLSRNTFQLPMRLPGADQYLKILDTEVVRAVEGELTASDALANVKRAWQALSEKLNVESQVRAWQANRGLPR